MQARSATLAQALFPSRSLVREVLLVVGFAIVTAGCARISIPVPWSPVPITGQTFGVLLTGAVLGSRRGALSMLVYISVGAAGAPFWFSPMAPRGLAALTTYPGAGFIVGFLPAAFVVGFLAERGWDRRFWTAALAMLVGEVVLYAFGLPKMAQFSRVLQAIYSGALKDWPWLASIPGGLVFKAGVLPYIPGDVTKLLLAAAALPSAWRLVHRLK